jgi:hypothetical protein
VFESAPYTITTGGGEQSSGDVETVWRRQDGVWRLSSISVTVH